MTTRKAKPKKKEPTWRDAIPRLTRKKRKRDAKSGRQRKVKVAIVTAVACSEGQLPSLVFTKPITFIRPLCFAVYEGEVIAVGANSGAVREWISVNMLTKRSTLKG
jgi:hypothetical protein